MSIDFTKLGGSDASDTIIEPRDLFNVLPAKNPRYRYARDVQADVWAQWFARRTERDLTLKMNTGGGKTVVGLVMLKSSINEGLGPAVYVAPSAPLVRQVLAEAKALGIETTEDATSARYASGKAILVINIHKLINGLSTFGVGDQGIQIPIGSVIIDDAHACLSASEEQFAIRLNSSHPAYAVLLKLFYGDLERQAPTRALEVKEEDIGQNMVVPYWSWIDKQDGVIAALHVERKSDALKFSYPLLKNHLALCECVFGGGEVEIAPRCLPIDMIPSFAAARRRIFMSATFGNDGILVTHFDASPDSVERPITPTSAGDIGDRIILVPQQLNPNLTEDDLKTFFAQCSAWANVVVIVPSERRAKFWSDVAAETLRSGDVIEGVARLRAGHVGLVVLVNKYDGIDLPEGACRILVIDGLPDVRGRLDKIEHALLLGSSEVVRGNIQRVEQGMGRGIRSNEDHCAVFLMGRSLTGQLYLPSALTFFTPATRAQLDLSDQLAKQLQLPSVTQMHDVVKRFLEREDGWVRASKAAVVRAKPPANTTLPIVALQQRKAFNAASRRDFKQACAEMQIAVDAEKDKLVKAWLLWQLAEYMHKVDAAQSQQILKNAVELNPQLLRPLDGIEYVKLPGQLRSQALLCLEYLRGAFAHGNAFIIAMNAYLDVLIFQPETADRFERALADIAAILGFVGQLPERDFGRGPDVLWSLGQQRFLVIECKNGATGNTISKEYCNQLTGSMTWFKDKYGDTCTAVPLMVHPAEVTEYAATMLPEARLIREAQLAALRTALRDFAVALASKTRFGTEAEVAAALTHYKLTAEHFVPTYSTKPKKKV